MHASHSSVLQEIFRQQMALSGNQTVKIHSKGPLMEFTLLTS